MLLFWFLFSIFSLMFLQPALPDSGEIGPIVALITGRALQLTSIVNVITNACAKHLAGVSGKWLPVIAVVVGIAIDFGILAIGASPFNRQTIVMALVAGALAGAGSKILADVHTATTTTKTVESPQ